MPEDIAARFERLGKLQVGILVFPDVEVLDFAGPFEVFSVASRIAAAEIGVPDPFGVTLVGATGAAVRARHGLIVLPHTSFDSARRSTC